MKEDKYHICPSLLQRVKGESGYSAKAEKLLFDGVSVSPILPYENLDTDPSVIDTFTDNSKRISLSGVQIKFSLLVDGGVLRLTTASEQGLYILKPKPGHIRNAVYCAANEHLTMQIASQIFKIQTAPNGLCFFSSGEPAYFVRRFDIVGDEKLRKEDFAALAGLTNRQGGSNYKYDHLSYQDFAILIDRYSSMPMVDKYRFFTLMVFNYVFCNGDAHLKNFSLLEDNRGKFKLSPAYDLLNTRLHVDDEIFAMRRGLFSEPKSGYFYGSSLAVVGRTFFEFGRLIGLPDTSIKNVLDSFCEIRPETDELIDNSFLSDDLKKEYKLNYKGRINSYLTIRE